MDPLMNTTRIESERKSHGIRGGTGINRMVVSKCNAGDVGLEQSKSAWCSTGDGNEQAQKEESSLSRSGANDSTVTIDTPREVG
jgi:hypothetical protein